MGLNYQNLKLKSLRKTIKNESEKGLEIAIKTGFPHCKGLYPDCPAEPSKDIRICKLCPVLEE